MKKLVLIIFLNILVISCTSDSSSETTNYLSEIPSTVVDNILKNRLQLVNTKMTDLKKTVVDFTNNVNVSNLEKVQKSYKELASVYAKMYVFNVGDAKGNFFNRRINFWPVYNLAIEKAISTNDNISEEKFKNYGSASRNLPGIQYLLFKDEDNNKITDEFKTQPLRKKYLIMATDELEVLFKSVNDLWFGEENYATTFKSKTEQGLKGAFNLLYNGMYNVVDNNKVTKIGKPAGLEKSSHTNPEIVEAFYSKQSLALIKSNLESIEELFFSDKITNIASYIESISKNKDITNKLKTQINTCYSIIDSIQVPLKTAVDSEKDKVKNLHKAYANLLAIMNADIRSALSIIITGTDNDGD